MASLDRFIEYQLYLNILRISIPFIIAFGTAGNAISVIVLLKPKQRHCSIARILTALAFTDLFLLWVGGLNHWTQVMFGIKIGDSSNFACKCLSFLGFCSGQMSTLFIGTLTLNRLIAIMLPLRVKSICSLGNTNVMIIMTVILSILVNCHTFVGLGLTEEGRCARIEEIYSTLPMQVWTFLQIALLLIMPVVFVIIANAIIGARLAFRKMIPSKPQVGIKKLNVQRATRTTKVLILLSVVYLVSVTPIAVFFMKYGGKQLGYGTEHHDAEVLLFWGVALTVYFTNSATNFVLYFLFASKFRKEVKRLFIYKQNN